MPEKPHAYAPREEVSLASSNLAGVPDFSQQVDEVAVGLTEGALAFEFCTSCGPQQLGWLEASRFDNFVRAVPLNTGHALNATHPAG